MIAGSPLAKGQIIVLGDRCFRVENVIRDEIGDPVVVAECLERLPNEQSAWWHFPVAGKKGLRAFAEHSQRVLH